MKTSLTILNSFSTLKFSGAKAQEFLQGQLTCDMRELNQHGTYSLAACCDHRGRMIANFWVINWHSDFLFILPKSLSETIKNHLQKFAVFSKVNITHQDHFFIAELNSGSGSDCVFILLPSKDRYLIIAENNPFSDIEINTDETKWKKNNIADQLCILYPETSLLFTPQMIGLEKLGGVSFNKGCYVGQEIVARTEYLGKLKKHLKRLTLVSDHALLPGEKIENTEEIGTIVEAVSLTENQYDVLAVTQSVHDKIDRN